MKGFSLKPEGTVNAFGNKQFGVFLEPGDQLRVSASVADVVDATCSYYSVDTDQTPQSLALVDGSCPNPDWVICSDGLTCASSLDKCPQSASVTGLTFESMGSTINLSDYFLTDSSMTHFSGSTGSQFVVPEEDNFAVFISSHGGVSSSWVTGGQTLVFRSDVLTGVGKCECDCVPPENYDIDCYYVDNTKKCACPDGTPSSCTPESCVCDLVLREGGPNRCYELAQSSSSSSSGILPSIKVENMEPTGCCCAYEGNRIQCISGVTRSQCNSDHSMMFDIGCVDCGFSWIEGAC